MSDLIPTNRSPLNPLNQPLIDTAPGVIGIENLELYGALDKARGITIDALNYAADIATQLDPLGEHDELDRMQEELSDLDDFLQQAELTYNPNLNNPYTRFSDGLGDLYGLD